MQRLLVMTCVAAFGVGAFVSGSSAAPASATRGRMIARQACAACHAVEPGGVSAQARAPGFGTTEMQHVAGLEGRVAALTRDGHYGMPPIPLTPGEVADLVAYIEHLGAPAKPQPWNR